MTAVLSLCQRTHHQLSQGNVKHLLRSVVSDQVLGMDFLPDQVSE